MKAEYVAQTAAGLDYVAIANKGVRSFIKQVLEDGWFHADTHPGNVLLCAQKPLTAPAA